MKIIVAVDNNWAIGHNGQLLVSIPADRRMFRNETKNKVVVFGRKTLSTFPNSLPLDQRTNIILSSREDYNVRSIETGTAIMARSVEDVLDLISQYDSDDVYVIGGASVYKEMLPYVDTCIVTRLDREYEADAYFPNLEKSTDWEMTEESDEQYYFDNCYTFQKWVRVDGGVKA